MAGELITVRGTEKTIVSSGTAVSSGAMSAASAATYGTTADGADYPDAEFVLTVTFGAAPTVMRTLALYARPLDIDGTSDSPVPSTTYQQKMVGSFVVSGDTTQSLICTARNLPKLAEYYVYNVDTGQSMSAGWTLKVTPLSRTKAA